MAKAIRDEDVGSIEELVAKAKCIQDKHINCGRDWGHDYRVQGFSLITHPELSFKAIPDERNLEDIKFSSYVCSACGKRVSTEEGREYMCRKKNRWAENPYGEIYDVL